MHSPETGRNQGSEGGGWTPAQAPTKSPSPGWGFRGPQVPKGIPPVLEDKPAHLSRPIRSHPPPPAYPTQRPMVTLTFGPPPPPPPASESASSWVLSAARGQPPLLLLLLLLGSHPFSRPQEASQVLTGISTPPGPHHFVMFSFLSLLKGPRLMVKMLHFRARQPPGLNSNRAACYLSGLEKLV